MSRTPFAMLAVAALAAAAPRAASAHGVVSEIDRRDGAVAVRLRYHDGPPLANAPYEVRSPRGRDAPYAQGRTDRHGWVAFTPHVAGAWQVRIVDASGHGKVVEVDVDAVAAQAAPAAPAAAVAAPAPAPNAAPAAPIAPPPPAGDVDPSVARIVAGAAGIAALFGAVYAFQRGRRRKGP